MSRNLSTLLVLVLASFGNAYHVRIEEPGISELIPEDTTITHEIELLLHNDTTESSTAHCTANLTEEMFFPAKNGIIGGHYRWKDFHVYIEPSYNDNERTLINNGLARLQKVLPCVNFGIYNKGFQPSGDYIHVKKGSGCFSVIGRQGGGQVVTLQSPGCMRIDLIMHEMIHALGLHHEQCRTDRDDHITVHRANIQDGMSINFDKLPSYEWSNFGIPYNTRSLMHYNGNDFSKNGRPTITAKDGSAVGPAGGLQETDKQKLKAMYKC